MNLLYLSSDPIGIPCLERLADPGGGLPRIGGVVTGPDRRKGRGKSMQRNPVAAAADRLGLPVLQTERLTPDLLAGFGSFDAALVFAFGQILPRGVLDLFPGAFLNIHPSPLPELRGPSPIETAIAEGWSATEICLMRMTLRMDAGDVAARIPVTIGAEEDAAAVRGKVAGRSVGLLAEIPAALGDPSLWKSQDPSRATWSRIIRKEDGWADFSLAATRIAARSRAFAGWPGTLVRLRGETVRLADLRTTEGSGEPGRILEAGDRLVVAAGRGAVSIGSLQRPTRRMLPWPEFRKAGALRPGGFLGYRLSEPLVRLTQRRT